MAIPSSRILSLILAILAFRPCVSSLIWWLLIRCLGRRPLEMWWHVRLVICVWRIRWSDARPRLEVRHHRVMWHTMRHRHRWSPLICIWRILVHRMWCRMHFIDVMLWWWILGIRVRRRIGWILRTTIIWSICIISCSIILRLFFTRCIRFRFLFRASFIVSPVLVTPSRIRWRRWGWLARWWRWGWLDGWWRWWLTGYSHWRRLWI